MSMYQNFVTAVNESGNERIKLTGKALIHQCRKYYSVYMQYEELKKINKFLSQTYHTNDAVMEERMEWKVKPKSLSILDKQMLKFITDYERIIAEEKRNAIKQKLDETKIRVQSESKERAEQLRAVLKKAQTEANETPKTIVDFLCLVTENDREVDNIIDCINRFPEAKPMIKKAVRNYKMLLKSRLKDTKRDTRELREMMKQSDIKLTNIDKMIAIYEKNKITSMISPEETFEKVFNEKYIDYLIHIIHRYGDEISAAHFSFATVQPVSRLSSGAIKCKDSSLYFRTTFSWKLDELQIKVKMMVENYGVIFEPYIQNKNKIENALKDAKGPAQCYAQDDIEKIFG